MKKLEKGFTLVELLVVIGILGILMSVLYPAISSAMSKTQLTACTMQGRKLFQAITQAGIDCPEKDEIAMWPRSSNTKSDDSTDITGVVHSTAVEYFKDLFDLTRYGETTYDPYVKGLDVSVLYGCGVPSFTGKNIQSRNVMWIIGQGVTADMPDVLPMMMTRNADYTKMITSGSFTGDTATQVGVGKDNGGESNTPFGKNAFVVVRKGGGVDVIESRYSKLNKIYNQQSFTISSDATFTYLKTGASN